MSALAVIPAYTRRDADLQMLSRCLGTLKEHAPEADVLVVDDCSPHPGTAMLATSMGAQVAEQDENGGFSKAVNVGLRLAMEEGKDAVLVNSDVEFDRPWLCHMLEDQADVVGALLYYPFGLVQHAGVYFSILTRAWDHLFRYAPLDLEEVQQRRTCPVTAALMMIRHSTLLNVGFYDEEFPLAFEDVDYCLRTFDAGLECAYQPRANALHHESVSRGDGHKGECERESWQRLVEKHHADTKSFERFVYP